MGVWFRRPLSGPWLLNRILDPENYDGSFGRKALRVLGPGWNQTPFSGTYVALNAVNGQVKNSLTDHYIVGRRVSVEGRAAVFAGGNSDIAFVAVDPTQTEQAIRNVCQGVSSIES